MSLSFFDKIIYLNSVDSTNTHLKNAGFEENTIIYTYNQKKGRGRNNKTWIDIENKNVALSFLLNKFDNFNNNLWYIAATSMALINILEKLSIKNYWIKWPNDVYINNKKLAGILTESIWRANKLDKLIVGIGININCDINDLSKKNLQATSILIESGEKQDLNNFINIFISELADLLQLIEKEEGIEELREKWKDNSKIINKNVEWINAKQKKTGIISDIESNGALLFKDEQGNIHKIISGEIKII